MSGMHLFFGILFFNLTVDGWEVLSTVEIVMGYDEFMGTEVEKPIFSDMLKAAEGGEFSLEGYMIPTEIYEDQNFLILSRFPYQSCFFCGGAGPETVVEVYSGASFLYTDQKVKVTGILRLNADDPLHLFYLLEQAEIEIVE